MLDPLFQGADKSSLIQIALMINLNSHLTNVLLLHMQSREKHKTLPPA